MPQCHNERTNLHEQSCTPPELGTLSSQTQLRLSNLQNQIRNAHLSIDGWFGAGTNVSDSLVTLTTALERTDKASTNRIRDVDARSRSVSDKMVLMKSSIKSFKWEENLEEQILLYCHLWMYFMALAPLLIEFKRCSVLQS